MWTGAPGWEEALSTRVRNAAARYRASRAVEEERTFVAEALDSLDDTFFVIDGNGRLLEWNERVPAVTGYDEDDLDSMTVLELIAEEDRPDVVEAIAAASAGESVEVSATVETRGGDRIPYEGRASRLSDGADDGVRIVGVGRDVSERERVEAELRERERQFRAVFEESFDAMVIADDDGRFVDVNPAACELFGLDRDELLGRTVGEFAAPDDDVEGSWRVFRESELERGTFPLVRPDGTERVVEFAATPDIRPDRNLSVMRDVTERRERARALERTIDRVTDAIVRVDGDWQFTFVDRRAEEIYDMDAADLAGRDFWEVFSTALGTRFEEEYRRVMETREPTSFEEHFPGLDGWFQVNVYPDDGGGLSFYFRDVTERKERERALEASERRYRTLAENFPNGAVVLFDEELRYTVAGGEVLDELGLPAEEMEGSTIHELYDDGIVDVLEPRYRAAFDGESAVFELEFADREWLVRVVPVTDGDGEVLAGMSVSRDITERNERVQRFRQVTEHIDQAFWMIDADYEEYLYYSPDFESIWGRTFDETDDIPGAFLETIHPDDRERIAEGLHRQREGGYDVEYRIVRPDGEVRWIRDRASPIENADGEVYRIAGVSEDVTERKERERDLELFRNLLDESTDAILVADSDAGRILDANETACRRLGYDCDALLDLRMTDIEVGLTDGDAWRARVDAAREAGSVLVRDELRRRNGTTYPAEVHITPVELDREYLVAVARDVSEREAYERTLATLHAAARDLQRAKTVDEIVELVAGAATDVIDLYGVTVYRYDPTENRLRPSVVPDEIEDLYDGELPEISPGEGITGRVFIDGETLALDDVHDSSRLLEGREDVAMRSGLFVPLGDHGVLVAGDADPGAFDERTVELAELLGATAEAALDRAERATDLRERDRELRRQSDRVDRLEGIHGKLQSIRRALVHGDTRDAIQRTVCEELAGVERFAFVWIGEPDPVSGELVPRARAGTRTAKGYLDAVSLDVDEAATEPALVTAHTGDPTVRPNIGTDIGQNGWRGEALARDLQSALAVPLAYDGVLYGVMAVYADRADAFDDLSREVLQNAGETIAYAVNAVERKNALLCDAGVRLEFETSSPDCVLLALARAAECSLAFEEAIPAGDGDTSLFLRAADGSPEGIRDGLSAAAGVSDVGVIRTSDDGGVFEVRTSRPFLGRALADHGIALRELRADQSSARIVLEVPTNADVHAAVDAMDAILPEATLVAKRGSSSQDGDPDSIRSAEGEPGAVAASRLPWDGLEDLTPRQREVLQAAYHGGFFDDPRERTGEEIAETLDITSPTFHHHLRTAQRKLLSRLLGREGPPPSK